MRNPVHQGGLAIALVLAMAVTACSDAGATLAPGGTPKQTNDETIYLNPQPEPPSLLLQFALSPDGTDWYGHVYVGDQSCGTMQLLQDTVWQSGIVTHVGYSLSVVGDNPDFAMDAAVAGIAVRGMVVLNGSVDSGAYAGQTLHPMGQIQTGGDSGDLEATMLGIIMLNPQPEPPSDAYPPSPCGQ
jgi:hypothetical protein